MSASGAWGPAPQGVDLSQNQNAAIIGSVVAIMTIGLSAVVLRVVTRLKYSGPGLAEDDYMIMVAAVCPPSRALHFEWTNDRFDSRS